MLKIGVVGFTGRMNKVVIEEIMTNHDCMLSGILIHKSTNQSEQDFQVTINDQSINLYDSVKELAANVDAIIDFTNPVSTLSISREMANCKAILVSGSTGFTAEQFHEFKENAKSVTIIWSSNMSIGINLLQLLIKIAANELDQEFDSAIIDIHHKLKKDTPSGTALMLANVIEATRSNDKVQISSLRIGDVPGEHQVIFSSPNEALCFKHQAFNRNIFAHGALKACFWGQNKAAGLYSMQDVLNNALN